MGGYLCFLREILSALPCWEYGILKRKRGKGPLLWGSEGVDVCFQERMSCWQTVRTGSIPEPRRPAASYCPCSRVLPPDFRVILETPEAQDRGQSGLPMLGKSWRLLTEEPVSRA